jgi:hypothetical protein
MLRAIDYLRGRLGDDLPRCMGIKIAEIMEDYFKVRITGGTGGVWYSSHTGNVYTAKDVGDGMYMAICSSSDSIEYRLIKRDDCEVIDSVVDTVVDKIKSRSQVGIRKYGTTMDRKDLSLIDWLTHLQEELLDAALYVEKLKEYEERQGRA